MAGENNFDDKNYDAKMQEYMGEGGGGGESFFTEWEESYDSFDTMGLHENLLRGIYAYGFEKPSAIQQKGIVPFAKSLDVIQQAQSGTGKTATFCAGILQNLDYNQVECQALVLAPTRERDVLPKVFSMLAQLLSGTSSSHITITKYQRQSSRFLVHFQLRDDREGRIAYRLPKMVLNRGLKDKYEFLGYGAVPAKRLPDAPPANAKPAAEEEEEEEEGMEEKEAEAEEEAEDGAAAEVDD